MPIAQGIITKHSQTIIPYTDNRPTSTNQVQTCIALIKKLAQPQQISLDEFLRYGSSSGWCSSKKPRCDSNEVVSIDNNPEVSSGTSTDHKDEHTHHEQYENDDNDYSNEDLSACATTNSNILCHDDEYESEDLLDFTNSTRYGSTSESEPLPASETLLPELSNEEQDCNDRNKDALYVCWQMNTDSESTTSNWSVSDCTSSECCGEHQLQPCHPKISLSLTTKQQGRQCRSFNVSWYRDFQWLTFCPSRQKVFCFYCRKAAFKGLFSSVSRIDSTLVTKGFSNWKHAREKLQSHEKRQVHREAFYKYNALNKQPSVREQLHSQVLREQQCQREMLLNRSHH